VTSKLELEVAGASKSAVEAVERAGGSVTVTYTKKVNLNKKGTPGKRQQRRVKSAETRASRKAGSAPI
jgi:large subunit ribosomal protein L15